MRRDALNGHDVVGRAFSSDADAAVRHASLHVEGEDAALRAFVQKVYGVVGRYGAVALLISGVGYAYRARVVATWFSAIAQSRDIAIPPFMSSTPGP